MIGIKSTTSGQILSCTHIKQSGLRSLCGMPDVQVEVKQTDLGGPITWKNKWVYESDIVDIPQEPMTATEVKARMEEFEQSRGPETVNEWEMLLLGVCYAGIRHKLESGEELTGAQQALYDQYLLGKGGNNENESNTD